MRDQWPQGVGGVSSAAASGHGTALSTAADPPKAARFGSFQVNLCSLPTCAAAGTGGKDGGGGGRG